MPRRSAERASGHAGDRDAARLEPGTIELHRPSLDGVFLTKTGRSIRKS
jgi:hypothetical protein